MDQCPGSRPHKAQSRGDQGAQVPYEREYEILANGRKRVAAEGEGRRNLTEVVGEQRHVGDFQRHVGAAHADGNRHVGRR